MDSNTTSGADASTGSRIRYLRQPHLTVDQSRRRGVKSLEQFISASRRSSCPKDPRNRSRAVTDRHDTPPWMLLCCNVRFWIPSCTAYVRFSNRPVRVKRFQTIHRCSVDVARGLVLLFGIGTKALPVWDSRTRWNNLLGGLAVKRTAGPSGQTNSPHPPSCEGHLSTARWSSGFLLSHLVLYRSHAAASSRVQRNSLPSTHMRCMMTASRRAKATIAFFIPRCLAIFTAQALSHDHLLARVNMT